MKPECQPHGLFEGIARESFIGLLDHCQLQEFLPGDILLNAGQTNEYLYLILSGELAIKISLDQDEALLTIQAGETVGEMSIIDNQPASAYVVAAAPTQIAAIPANTFWNKVALIPGVSRNLMRLFAQRMRRQNETIRHALEQELRMAQMQKELDNARHIQQHMLPHIEPLLPEYPQLEVAASMDAAKDVGGDLFDALALDDDRVAVMVGDVSGKGMAAALFMVKALTVIRTELRMPLPLETIMERINHTLCQDNDSCMFVTLFLAILDVRTGLMRYVHGGHNPPVLKRHGQAAEFLPLPKGLVVGIAEDFKFPAREVQLRPCDYVVIYTDGVTEAENSERHMYGDQALLNLIDHQDDAPAKEVRRTVRSAVEGFSKGVDQSDDVTLLVCRYLG